MASTDPKSILVAALLAALPGAASAAGTVEASVETLTLRRGELVLVVRLKAEKPPEGKVFVGVTLLKPRQTENGFDLPAQEVQPADLGKPLTFRAKVGPGFVAYAVGVWGSKAPDASHPLGYRLHEPLGGFPENPFGEGGELAWGDATYHRLLERPLKVRVMDAGAGPEAVAEVRKVLSETLAKDPFQLVDGGKAQAPRQQIEILIRDAGHSALARELSRKLGRPALVKPWSEAPDPIVVAVGK